MKLRFEGVVEIGDGNRDADDMIHGAIHIGGKDVVDELHEERWSENVVARINGTEVARGNAIINIGHVYSEYTADSDTVFIDNYTFDLIDALGNYENQSIVLEVEDVE